MAPRVCFVSPHVYGYFDPDHGFTGGGAERQTYLLSTALADRFDVHVVVGDYDQPKREVREGVTLHRAYPLGARQHVLEPAKHLLMLGVAMRRADADVYVHRGAPDNAPFVYLLTRLLGRAWVYHVANDEHLQSFPANFSPPLRWLYGRALRGADAVIAQTEYQQRTLRQKYDTGATVIPNGYPSGDDFVPYDRRKYLLWVGRIDRDQKRPHLYLDLAEAVPEYEFRLVGPVDTSRPYQQEVVQRARELENVTVLGEIPPHTIHEQYRHAVALVCTSSYEGFPNTYLEAWRQGTPVVSLTVDIGRFLEDGDVSTYADDDVDEMRTLIRELAEDRSYRKRIGERCQDRFEERYRIQAVADQYGKALESALSNE